MIGYGKRVLLVHDPQTMHPPLAALLKQEGFVVVQISNEIRALREMHSRRFDAVVTDYLPGSTGLALLSQLHMIRPAIPVILFSEVNWDICATTSRSLRLDSEVVYLRHPIEHIGIGDEAEPGTGIGPGTRGGYGLR